MENRRDEKMHKQRMIRMLEDAKDAVVAAGLASATATRTEGEVMSEGDNALIGQLILASAIENSGSLISDSLDKLDKLALELSEVARVLSR